jgi:thiol-disulfide isomerase/thioredoxin
MIFLQYFRLIFLALVLSMTAMANASATLAAGDLPPDKVGKTLDGETISLSRFAGKVVVVSFWATWCPYCLKELPILEGIQKTVGKGQIEVIAVNTESRDVFKKVKRAMSNLTLQLLYDPSEESAKAYGVKGIPHLVIIGRDGRIVEVYRGYGESSLDGIVEDLNLALAAPATIVE